MTYDKDAIRNIVDAAPMLHVSFNAPPIESTEPQSPIVLPILGAMSLGASTDDIYLRGSSAAHLFRHGAEQQEIRIPVRIAATLLDDYVLAPWCLNMQPKSTTRTR